MLATLGHNLYLIAVFHQKLPSWSIMGVDVIWPVWQKPHDQVSVMGEQLLFRRRAIRLRPQEIWLSPELNWNGETSLYAYLKVLIAQLLSNTIVWCFNLFPTECYIPEIWFLAPAEFAPGRVYTTADFLNCCIILYSRLTKIVIKQNCAFS